MIGKETETASVGETYALCQVGSRWRGARDRRGGMKYHRVGGARAMNFVATPE